MYTETMGISWKVVNRSTLPTGRAECACSREQLLDAATVSRFYKYPIGPSLE